MIEFHQEITPSQEALNLEIMDLEYRESQLVERIQKDKEDNRIVHFTRPNPPQEDLLHAWLDNEYKVFTYTGGNRSGKTTLGAILSICTMIGFYPWNRQKLKFPHRKPRKVRLVGQDWDKHIGQVVIPALKMWWPKDRPLKTKKNNVGIESFWLDEETGSTLEIMSNNQDSDLHEGWDGDLIYYDEPPKRDIRIANSRGLVDRDGRELFCMTLLKEAWVDKDVIKAINEDGTPDTSVYNVHASIYDNIGYGLTQKGVDNFARKLDEDEKDARLKGIPSYMSGLILPQFKRSIHLKKRPAKFPLDWILDIAIDFHPSKEWAVLFLATDSRNFKYCIHEMWKHGSWKAIGEEIVRTIARLGLRVSNIIIDPLAKGDKNSDLQEESVYDKLYHLFAQYGYRLSTATKDKDGGIIMIKDLLMTENEMPAIFFLNDLVRLLFEIEGWMYDEKGKPIKENDDQMENLYRLVLLDTQYEAPSPEEDEDYQHPAASNESWCGY